MSEEKICPRCGSKMELTTNNMDLALISSATATVDVTSINVDKKIEYVWFCPDCRLII